MKKYSYIEMIHPVFNSIIFAIKYRIERKSDVSAKLAKYTCDHNGKNLLIYGLNFGYDYVFKRERYKNLQVFDNDVLDVGANIGDSSIYFYCKGAKTVYCVEPSPFLFKILKANIIYNGLQQKLIPLNKGIGNERTMRLSNGPLSDDIINKGLPIRESQSNNTSAVKIESLEKIVNELHIKDAILKMSCEGCEYEAITESSKATLRAFKIIFVEFFNGKQKRLGKKLIQCGFRIKYRNVTYDYKRDRILGFIVGLREW